MRVLTVVCDLGPGGTQRVAQNYAIGYAKSGFASAVLTIYDGGIRAKDLADAGIEMFLGGNSQEDRDKAVELAKKWGPDVVHVHRHGRYDPDTGSVMREFKEQGCPILETNVFARVDYSSDRELIDVHLHLSRCSLWKWQKWSQIAKPKPIGVVVPYAVDTAAFYPSSYEERLEFRGKNGIPEEAFLFGRIGQPWLGKWSPIIFDAFKRVAQDHKDIYLLLVGLPRQLRSKIESLPSNVKKRIIEIPFIYGDENLRFCYSSMDTFLHASSIGESFGLVLAEAMLCGCPVITLSTPAKDNSQLEVVGHQRGGLVVTDRQSMVEGMERLYSDRDLRNKLATQGAEWVRSNYDVSRVVPRLARILDIVLEVKSRSELRRILENDPDLTTHVDDSEILSLLDKSLGKTSLRSHTLMKIVHNPYIYKFYLSIKTKWNHS